MNVCTIIAKNYIAYARVLARSLAQEHPGSRLWTLIIDDISGYVDPPAEPFQVLTPSDIGCEPFTSMALSYSVLELSTAVKPWLLRHLMAETGEPVTYLDPDIEIHSSLESLDELAAQHGVVLTPHNSAPIPQDGRKPSQVDIMIAGIYNLGYVSLAPRPEVHRLLDWWADRLERDCRVDPIWGYFVDQRWFDLAPGFLSDLAIVRDRRYNLAYWNLHEDQLAYDDGQYLVGDKPLAFFHFSGFDPDHPSVLSRYQDRIDVPGDPVLSRLLAGYAKKVLAEGHTDTRHWPYSYQALADGTRLTDTLRSLFEEFALQRGSELVSPFTLAGTRQFQSWLLAPAPGAPPGINRLLDGVYERRSDLWRAYTTPGGVDATGLLEWAREYGEQEEPMLSRMWASSDDHKPAEPATREPAEPATREPTPEASAVRAELAESRRAVHGSQSQDGAGPLHTEPWGVNVVGYFRSELGTGEAARQLVSALDAEEVPLLPIHGQTVPLSRQTHPYETASPEDAPFPINLICMNADMLPEFAKQVGTGFFANRYSIGLWFWEIARFPEPWRDSFSLLEEVWAPTAHIAAALEPLATVPVTTVRVPVQPALLERRSCADLGLAENRFSFLFSFDYLSVAERKNPLDAIAAFRHAFQPGDGAELIVKCINHEHDPTYHSQVQSAIAGHADIRLIDRYMSPNDNSNLVALCDCYVSLHRAEGFGLVLADAMWHGKPVIATGYSGNLDFMTADNSLLVDYELVPVGAGFDPYPEDATWAQPNVEHAASLMRRVFDDPGEAQRLGIAAAGDIRQTHSPDAAGKILGRRLESIRGTGRVRPRARTGYARSPALAALPLKIRQGPEKVAAERRAPRELIRTLALRAMRPFTAYQQQVNREMVDAVREVSERLGDVRRDAAPELARVLTQLRKAGELQGLESLITEQAQRIDALERRLADADASPSRREPPRRA